MQVQARGIVGGEPLIRKTTVKADTENPKWNEKIMFGPMPWDSGIAFQLFEEDTIWDDPIKLYIEGRKCMSAEHWSEGPGCCMFTGFLSMHDTDSLAGVALVIRFAVAHCLPPIWFLLQGPVTTTVATSGSGPG